MRPTVFISYSWDTPNHKTWVRRLAEQLVARGVKVHLDQWEVKAGQSLTKFMEEIAASDYVVVVLTPAYARKANRRRGGVGYEHQIVTGQVMQGYDRSKFIPILRVGKLEPGPRCAVPVHFSGVKALDFRLDRQFLQSLEELLHAIYAKPKFGPPKLGKRPKLLTSRRTRLPAPRPQLARPRRKKASQILGKRQLQKWGDRILNYAYFPSEGGRKHFFWQDIIFSWMYAYQRYVGKEEMSNIDVLMSQFPMHVNRQTGLQELGNPKLRAAMDYLVARGYLSRRTDPIFGESFEITDTGRAYISPKLTSSTAGTLEEPT